MSEDHLPDEIAALQARLAENPNDRDVAHDLADAYADRGQWAEAMAAYQAAITLDPSDAELYNSLGTVYEELGRAEDARQAYQKALTLRPLYSMAYWNMGRLSEEQHRTPEAIQALEKCVRCSKDPEERFAARKRLAALTGSTLTGQSTFAYRMSAAILALGILMSISVRPVLFRNVVAYVVPILVDIALVVGLAQLRPGARLLALMRTAVVAIATPLIWFARADFIPVWFARVDLMIPAAAQTLAAWGSCAALVLLLTGRTRPWRVVLALTLYVLLTWGVTLGYLVYEALILLRWVGGGNLGR